MSEFPRQLPTPAARPAASAVPPASPSVPPTSSSSPPPPIAYVVVVPDADSDHLRLIAIFHFVLGPIQLLFALFPLVYVAIGILFVSGVIPSDPHQSNGGDPEVIGWVFIAFGTAFTVIAGLFGALTLYSGFQIRARRRRMFSLVAAGINCVHFPFGTALGVFTLIVLLRRSVEALYRSTAR